MNMVCKNTYLRAILIIYSKHVRYHKKWNGRWIWNDTNLSSKSGYSVWEPFTAFRLSQGSPLLRQPWKACAAMSDSACFCCLLIASQILYLYTLFLIFRVFRKKQLNSLKYSCLALKSKRVFQGIWKSSVPETRISAPYTSVGVTAATERDQNYCARFAMICR